MPSDDEDDDGGSSVSHPQQCDGEQRVPSPGYTTLQSPHQQQQQDTIVKAPSTIHYYPQPQPHTMAFLPSSYAAKPPANMSYNWFAGQYLPNTGQHMDASEMPPVAAAHLYYQPNQHLYSPEFQQEYAHGPFGNGYNLGGPGGHGLGGSTGGGSAAGGSSGGSVAGNSGHADIGGIGAASQLHHVSGHHHHLHHHHSSVGGASSLQGGGGGNSVDGGLGVGAAGGVPSPPVTISPVTGNSAMSSPNMPIDHHHGSSPGGAAVVAAAAAAAAATVQEAAEAKRQYQWMTKNPQPQTGKSSLYSMMF